MCDSNTDSDTSTDSESDEYNGRLPRDYGKEAKLHKTLGNLDRNDNAKHAPSQSDKRNSGGFKLIVSAILLVVAVTLTLTLSGCVAAPQEPEADVETEAKDEGDGMFYILPFPFERPL